MSAPTPRTFAALLAYLSPNTSIQKNRKTAPRAWVNGWRNWYEPQKSTRAGFG